MMVHILVCLLLSFLLIPMGSNSWWNDTMHDELVAVLNLSASSTVVTRAQPGPNIKIVFARWATLLGGAAHVQNQSSMPGVADNTTCVIGRWKHGSAMLLNPCLRAVIQVEHLECVYLSLVLSWVDWLRAIRVDKTPGKTAQAAGLRPPMVVLLRHSKVSCQRFRSLAKCHSWVAKSSPQNVCHHGTMC